MLNTCARAGVTRFDKSNESEFLQIPSSHFARLVLTFFLKIPLAAYPNVTKNCNSRGIKQFNGQKLRDFHFLRCARKQLKQVKCLSARNMSEKLFSHDKLHTWTYRSYSTHPRSTLGFGRRLHSSSCCKSNSTVAAHTCKLKPATTVYFETRHL